MRKGVSVCTCLGLACAWVLALGFQARAVTMEDATDQGKDAFKITTDNAVFFIQKPNGGISSLLDNEGNDWIGYQPGGGASGEYRGIPNAIYPEGISHPGFNSASCTSTDESETSVEITCNSNNGLVTFVWTIYDIYATIKFTKVNTHNYWFLYEGTPGGAVEASDRWILSNGNSGGCNQNQDGDIPNPEWIAFADANKGHSLLLTHREDDSGVDKYYLMNPMTVFGFGRNGMSMSLSGQNTFNVAILDETDYDDIKPLAEKIMADDFVGVKHLIQKKAREAASPVTLQRLASGGVRIGLKNDGAHVLRLYDLAGRLAATYSGAQPAQYVITPANVGSGAFVLQCTANGAMFSRSLIVE